MAPRYTGSPSERFILCLVIYIFVSWMSKLCNIWGNENVEFSKSCSGKKIGRNVSHGLAIPGRQGKILPQEETKKSLMFVYHSVRTNLLWGWKVWIHLCLFHMKTTVLIRKEEEKWGNFLTINSCKREKICLQNHVSIMGWNNHLWIQTWAISASITPRCSCWKRPAQPYSLCIQKRDVEGWAFTWQLNTANGDLFLQGWSCSSGPDLHGASGCDPAAYSTAKLVLLSLSHSLHLTWEE